MSTTTNFKRIALVAVAALGMGVLSSVPSQAVVPATSLTLTAGTSGTALLENNTSTFSPDTSTGALVTVSFLAVTAGTDCVTLTLSPKSKPGTTTTYPKGLMTLFDTTSSTTAPAIYLESGTASTGINIGGNVGAALIATTSNGTGNTESGTAALLASNTANRYVTATFRIHMDTITTRAQGTYVYTVIATPYDAVAGGAVSANVKTVDVNIVVGAPTTSTSSAGSSTAVLSGGTSFNNVGVTADSIVAVPATASTTTRGVIRVSLRTSAGSALVAESVTVVSTVGSTGLTAGTPIGKNVTYAYPASAVTAGYLDIRIFSDGTAGTGSITVSTPSVTFAAKTVTFYSTTATKLTVISATSTLGVGTNTATASGLGTIWVKATDANGATVVANADGESGVWAYSSASTVVSDSATACTYSSAIGYHTCTLTGVAAGTATITIKNSGTNFNLATVSGDKTVAVTVSSATPASLKLAFDKATYSPGEKGYILISALDSAGKVLPGKTLTNLMATGGITLSGSFSGTAPTLTAVSYTTAPRVAAIDGCASTDAVSCLEFFAPYAGTKMTITATGGSLLPAAGQVAVTASAAVSDNGAAALAAVSALATTVASLKTLITTLTNLVLKIQKKVKA